MAQADIITKIMNEYGFSRAAAIEMTERAMQQAGRKVQSKRLSESRGKQLYHNFLRQASPHMDWETNMAAYLANTVDQVVAGHIINVAISLPPRVGKSEQITKRLPVYWLESRPHDKVIVGGYNHTLAKLFTGEAMKLYKARNPNNMVGQAEDDWGIVEGGTCRAVGVGSGVTGHGGDLILIDDPVKSHREAFSRAYREMVWNWYLNDLRSRRNNLATTPQIVIGTRWHSDDLIGRILKNADPGEWVEIRIPAIAGENDPLGRLPGESINPVRLPIRELMREKKLLGRRFDALFQQDPIDESCAIFYIDKIVMVDACPVDAWRVRYWDRAASEGKGDWTVGLLMAYDEHGISWVEDIVRGRWSPEEVRRRMRSTLERDQARYGSNGRYKVRTWFEREPAGDGKTAADDIVRMMAPYEIFSDRAADNKTARASGFAIQWNAGNVRVLEAEWVDEFKDELSRFVPDVDNGQDDQVDAASGAFNKLAIENAIVSIR
jgi:predicted phage terminase large subunit-like protein